ncbi:pilus assembly protein CpaE [Desulfonatronum thiosulfatophilum]|uniref:Pilus assembly protein CpaE n=1 Tax=Desulfonatronum thiosulfatophilum TaxID=617002 RepID=A0A1G6C832_9BACT|nr:AAA family ATPase [Desulfonatronum thiosulfatophilum]SDB29011.1 pilus assembly protein CpaE [Desulfonatronum thiosulfatophilum]
MNAGTYRVRLQIQSRILRKKFEDILNKQFEFEIIDNDSIRADLLIIELNEDPDVTFELIHNLLNDGEVGEVFLTSNSTDQALLLNAIRAGAREFLGPEAEDSEVAAALQRFAARQGKTKSSDRSTRSSRIFSVMGSKGGVGTTTFAVNLAVSLAEEESVDSVVLLDLNLFGDIPLFLEIEPAYTWKEINNNISRLDTTFLKNILAKDPSGVRVLPSPGSFGSQNIATPEIIQRLLSVMRQSFDFIVVDLGQHMDDNSLKVLEMSDTLFLISVQSLPCLATTNKLLRSFQDIGYPAPETIKVILNRHLKNGSIDMADVEKALSKKVFWKIPNDYQTTVSAINKGKPLSRFAPKMQITKSFKELADNLVAVTDQKEVAKKKWWIF